MKNNKNKINLETYSDDEPIKNEESGFSKFSNGLEKIWNKTIFSDKLRERKEQKKFERETKAKAREEAKPEIEKILKEKYKQEEIDKLTSKKNKNSFWEKLGKGFEGVDIASTEKLQSMLGNNVTNKENNNSSTDFNLKKFNIKNTNNKKSKKNKTKTTNTNKQKIQTNDFEDKIKRMLGK